MKFWSILSVLQSGIPSAEPLFVLPLRTGCYRWELSQSQTPMVSSTLIIWTDMSTMLMSGRSASMKMVSTVVLLTIVISMESRISLPRLVGKDPINHNCPFQALSSLLKLLIRALLLLRVKVKRGKEKPWPPKYLYLSSPLLRRVEGVLHTKELLEKSLWALKLPHLPLLQFLHLQLQML